MPHVDGGEELVRQYQERRADAANDPRPFETEERLPIVFDLDGTLAESTYPEPHVGRAITGMVNLARRYHNEDNREIIIHTARPESHKDLIWNWVYMNGLETVIYDVICGKPRAALYVDDRGWNPLGGKGQGSDSDVAGHGRASSEAPAPSSTVVHDRSISKKIDLRAVGRSYPEHQPLDDWPVPMGESPL